MGILNWKENTAVFGASILGTSIVGCTLLGAFTAVKVNTRVTRELLYTYFLLGYSYVLGKSIGARKNLNSDGKYEYTIYIPVPVKATFSWRVKDKTE